MLSTKYVPVIVQGVGRYEDKQGSLCFLVLPLAYSWLWPQAMILVFGVDTDDVHCVKAENSQEEFLSSFLPLSFQS